MPVKPLDLDLEDPGELEPVSLRYEAIRFLLRHRGAPVGLLLVENTVDTVARAAVLEEAVTHLAPEIWAELLTTESLEDAAAPETGAADVTVVVCTRGRPRELDRCLAGLSTQTSPPEAIVVVDNAPVDGAARDVAARWSLRYVVEPRPGLDWARNRGLAEVDTTLVAFTDDDVQPDPCWLEELVAGFASPDVCAVTGAVVAAEQETVAQRMFEEVYGGMTHGFAPAVWSRRGRPMTYSPNAYGCGANMAFRTALLRRLGGFDTALDVGTPTGGGGDLDALQRVLEADAAIAFRPRALVRHVHRRTRRQLRRQLFDNGRGLAAAHCAALARARGVERVRVLGASVRWLWWWHLRRVLARVVRRERLPMPLVLAELAGWLAGPAFFLAARRRSRRVARTHRSEA